MTDEYAYLPTDLTAENGAKGRLSGEFKEEIRVVCWSCTEGGFDEDCERCQGEGESVHKVPVSWTTIKEIWAMAVDHLLTYPPVPMPISDDAKGLNYWRAMKCGEMPKYIPARINIKKQILFGSETFGPGAFECYFCPITRTLFVLFGGEEAYLDPGEYEVLEWKKNEGENAEK